jgi:acetyl esterase/lipase
MSSYRNRLFKFLMGWSSKRAHKLEPVALRSSFEKNMRMVKPPPGTRIEPVDIDGVPCEWLSPGQSRSKPVILYLHGGAYVFGSINTHRAFAASLAAKSQASALVVGFRLAPESPFPAAFDDIVKCYRWLVNQGTAPRDIIIAGDSSGAGLALSLLVSLRDAGEPLPAAAVLISPWTDLTGSGESQKTFDRTDPMCKSAKLMEWAMMYAG